MKFGIDDFSMVTHCGDRFGVLKKTEEDTDCGTGAKYYEHKPHLNIK
jgi:hypothetical protein